MTGGLVEYKKREREKLPTTLTRISLFSLVGHVSGSRNSQTISQQQQQLEAKSISTDVTTSMRRRDTDSLKSDDPLGRGQAGENEGDLSPVAEVTESASESIHSCSDESCGKMKVESLDAGSLHYVTKGTGKVPPLGQTEGEAMSSDFDQLAKLHELYASVSSINAKSQQQLRDAVAHGSTMSLGALPNDNHNVDSLASSTNDLNSLCSEPAKMPDDPMHRRSGLDLDLSFMQNHPISISLSDLGFSINNKDCERSDSPVLEFIDHELSKYAKLRDLEQVYQQQAPTEADSPGKTSVSPPQPSQPPASRSDHVPDGASNPDLNGHTRKHPPRVPTPRRSPGTGQSSAGSEGEAEKSREVVAVIKNRVSETSRSHSRALKRGEEGGGGGGNVINPTQAVETVVATSNNSSSSFKRVPRFSRLFSKKISKSPLKIGEAGGLNHPRREEKEKATKKGGRKKTDKSNSSSPSTSKRQIQVLKQQDKTSTSKNVSGTLPLLPSASAVARAKPVTIPSPYSIETKPVKKSRVDTSSNDSGLGNEAASSFSSRGVRLRGKGANGVGAHARAKNCGSSGYESSQTESIESPTSRTNESSSGLLLYSAEEIERLDRRGRLEEVRMLKQEQQRLKEEMSQAKSRICADPLKWSYELHVEQSALNDKADPAFVEAFRKETQILKKRIDACKSHVRLVTCFDVKPELPKVPEGCTTECEFVQDIILSQDDEARAATLAESDLF